MKNMKKHIDDYCISTDSSDCKESGCDGVDYSCIGYIPYKKFDDIERNETLLKRLLTYIKK